MGRYGNGYGDGLIPSWDGLAGMQAVDRPHASSKAKQTRKRNIPISSLRFSQRQQMSTHRVLIEPTAYLTLTFLALGCSVFPVVCCVVVVAVVVLYF